MQSTQSSPRKAVDLRHIILCSTCMSYKLHTKCWKIKTNLKLIFERTFIFVNIWALLGDLSSKGLILSYDKIFCLHFALCICQNIVIKFVLWKVCRITCPRLTIFLSIFWAHWAQCTWKNVVNLIFLRLPFHDTRVFF